MRWGGVTGAIMRPMRLVRPVVLSALAMLSVCVLGVSPAAAHPAPFSYLDIVFRNGGIDGTLVIHTIDAAHELKIPTPDSLLDPAMLANQRDALTAVLTPRLVLRGGNQRLTPRWTGAEPMRAELALRLRFRIDNAQPGALASDTDLFPYDPQHQTFIGKSAGSEQLRPDFDRPVVGEFSKPAFLHGHHRQQARPT